LLKVTVLGSGTCVPSLKRSSCSVLMNINGTKLLFDLGAGTMKRLLEAGTTISEISYLFFSHLHPDHTGEFVPFLFATKYPETYRRRTSFMVAGARGFKNFYDDLRKVYKHWIELENGILNMVEFDNTAPDHLSLKVFEVETMPMEHIESSIGFRITTPEGTSVVYTGDTDLCNNAVTLARNVDLLICESALPDGMKVPGHLTPSLAGEIATRAKAKQLVLTHFYPECDTVDIEAECRKTYQGPLLLAEDLMQIEVGNSAFNINKLKSLQLRSLQ